MGRKVDVDNLVGAQEIADRLNVTRQVVHQWRTRHAAFPQPVAELGGDALGNRRAFHVWSWPDVEQWATKTGRYPPKADRDS